ncbi:hypothetical protein LCGC14_2691500, partial [marine sediment metagenome]
MDKKIESNVNFVTGDYKGICKKIAENKLAAILTNLLKKNYPVLKEIAGSGILKTDGYCTTFKSTKDFSDILKNRTQENDSILVILDVNSDRKKVMNVCIKYKDRAFTIIQDKVDDKNMNDKNISMNENTKSLLDEIIKSCDDKNFTTETNNFFKDKLKISLKTIGRCIKYLKENKYIIIEKYGQGKKIILISEDRQNRSKDRTGQKQNKVGQVIKTKDNQDIDPEPKEQDIEKEIESLKISMWKIKSVEGQLLNYETDLNHISIRSLIYQFGLSQIVESLEEFLTVN